MASTGQNRFRGESATLGVVDVMDAPLTMVSAMRGQVDETNQTLEIIRWTKVDLKYLKFTNFMKTNSPGFREDFNPNEAEE